VNISGQSLDAAWGGKKCKRKLSGGVIFKRLRGPDGERMGVVERERELSEVLVEKKSLPSKLTKKTRLLNRKQRHQSLKPKHDPLKPCSDLKN